MMFSKTFLCVIEWTFVRRLYILILTAAKEINQGTGHYFFFREGRGNLVPRAFSLVLGSGWRELDMYVFLAFRFAHESFFEVKLRT